MKETAKVHFIHINTGKLVLVQRVYHLPNVDDEIRIGGDGGEGNEHYYRVVRRVFVYDETSVDIDRVNIGVVEVKS